MSFFQLGGLLGTGVNLPAVSTAASQLANSPLQAQSQPPNYSGASKQSRFFIGNVELHDFEIPESFGPLGGDQVVAVHEFIGGTRQVHSLGPQPVPLTWTGILFGGDPVSGAKARALQLDALRQAGALVTLKWGIFKIDSVISQFHMEALNDWMIRYTITCSPLQDRNAKLPDGTPGAEETYQNILSNLAPQLSTAENLWDPSNQASAASALNNLLQADAQKITSFQQLPQANIQTALGFLNDVETDLQLVQSSNIPEDAANASLMLNQVSNLQSLLTGASGSPVQTAPLINPNLYELASMIYGDPTKWQLVAQANNIQTSTPLLTGSYPNFILSPMPIGGNL